MWRQTQQDKDWRCHLNGEYCPILVKETLVA
jgi:hypothetical protein